MKKLFLITLLVLSGCSLPTKNADSLDGYYRHLEAGLNIYLEIYGDSLKVIRETISGGTVNEITYFRGDRNHQKQYYTALWNREVRDINDQYYFALSGDKLTTVINHESGVVDTVEFKRE